MALYIRFKNDIVLKNIILVINISYLKQSGYSITVLILLLSTQQKLTLLAKYIPAEYVHKEARVIPRVLYAQFTKERSKQTTKAILMEQNVGTWFLLIIVITLINLLLNNKSECPFI